MNIHRHNGIFDSQRRLNTPIPGHEHDQENNPGQGDGARSIFPKGLLLFSIVAHEYPESLWQRMRSIK